MNNFLKVLEEARKTALIEGIRANKVVINNRYHKLMNVFLNYGIVGNASGKTITLANESIEIPAMILGLEVEFADDIPEEYSFALVESGITLAERLSNRINELYEENKTLVEILFRIYAMDMITKDIDLGKLPLKEAERELLERKLCELTAED